MPDHHVPTAPAADLAHGAIQPNASVLARLPVAAIAVMMSLLATSADAADWYVDNAASGANTGASWANAWKSFSTVTWGGSGVKAGDTLFVSGGSTSKTYADRLTVHAGGTGDSARVTVRVGQSTGHDGTVILTGGLTLSNQPFVTIDGEVAGRRALRVTNTGVSAQGADDFLLRYVEIDSAETGISAQYVGSPGTELEFAL